MKKADETAGQLDLLLMAAPAHGPVHGHKIIARMRADSGGMFALPVSTVCPVTAPSGEGRLHQLA
jgi:hypothetical protein